MGKKLSIKNFYISVVASFLTSYIVSRKHCKYYFINFYFLSARVLIQNIYMVKLDLVQSLMKMFKDNLLFILPSTDVVMGQK